MSFAKDVAQFSEKTKEKVSDVATDVFINIGTLIVSRTPVGDVTLWKSLRNTSAAGPIEPVAPPGYRPGTLVNSWTAGVGDSDSFVGPFAPREPNVNGATALANIKMIAKEYVGSVGYLINPAPYANRIEYDAHSSQAPAGMVRRTAVEFQSIVKVSVNGIK